jgi:hypothetical protein
MAGRAASRSLLGWRFPFEELAPGVRFLWGLRACLRPPLTAEIARTILSARLARREADFLALAHGAVYDNPGSPYRQLLELAGCQYGDLEGLVGREGLEGALVHLYREGVYLTIDELKGRRPAVRGSATLSIQPAQVRNPLVGFHVPTQTGGSRGARTLVPVALASVRDRAVNQCLVLEARGGGHWLKATWAVPGRIVSGVVRSSSFGAPMARYFSLVDPAEADLDPRYRWEVRALRLGSLLTGVPLPRPEYVPIADPLPIARWLAGVLGSGRTPHLFTFVSPALRLCQAATQAGIELRGAMATITGEPVTAVRLGLLERAGLHAVAEYGSAECGGSISYGCLAPEAPDEVHLFDDLHALIQAATPADRGELPGSAILVTSLRPTAPLILLNVSMGDRAVLTRRCCGCPLEELGWRTHLHTIRSFEKLTAGGMTFLDTDVIRVLEEVLPARFGGGPTDYQLAEEEGADGQPRLRLVVHPAVGPLDADALIEAFLAEIGSGAGAERVMAIQWRMARLLRVERRPPRATASGKILHLHREYQPMPRPDTIAGSPGTA